MLKQETMKRHSILLLPLFCLVLAGVAAGCRQRGEAPKQPCLLELRVSLPEYRTGWLRSTEGEPLDTLRFTEEGSALLTRTDTARMPYMALVCLVNPADSIDRMEMPVVIEGGTVSVEIGEYISTTGTPLNHKVQEFLNSLQGCKDALRLKQDATPEEVTGVFSDFYLQQILANRDNVVGRYLYRAYGQHLRTEERERAKAGLGE